MVGSALAIWIKYEDLVTLRRCIAFAKAWKYGALCMINLFAFRATEPADMLAAADPIGSNNDAHLIELARGAGVVVAAWGACGVHLGRDTAVRALVPNLHYLRKTKGGHPGHPLYLPSGLVPQQF